MESGLDIEYRTMLGHLAGTPTAIGPGGNGRVFSVVSFHENLANEGNNPATKALVDAWRAKQDFDFIFGERYVSVMQIAAAITKAGSTDPLKVALAMENLTVTDAAGQPATVRATDHQTTMTYYGVAFTKDVKFDSEKTGLGWKTTATIPGSDLAQQPTTCKMKRPAS